jgi:hypothetical protein
MKLKPIIRERKKERIMEKNYQKGASYKNVFNQISAAMDAGYFLEAITLEESIMTDRLYRFCRDNHYLQKAERATLGDELRFIKNLPEGLFKIEDPHIISDLDSFWMNRNKCLHQIAKSEPGKPTIDFEETYILAEETAKKGLRIIKRIKKWAEKYKAEIKKEL